MKLYELARVVAGSTNIVVFTMDRDGKVDGEFEGMAPAFRDPANDWEIDYVDADGSEIVVTALSEFA